MNLSWEKKEILIWGKTRPELSNKYYEIVCTGGVFADSKKLVRLYPIPLRYMDDEKYFRKYQWIEALVQKNESDHRPESFRIREDGIKILGKISSDQHWEQRAEWVLQPQNLYQSVEDLKAKEVENSTSLGIVKPKEILDISFKKTTQKQTAEYYAKRSDIIQQMELCEEAIKDIKPLRAPDFHFRCHFLCEDKRCNQPHIFSILDWEVEALYFRIAQKKEREEAAREVIRYLRDKIFNDQHDTRLFLGNINKSLQTFTIVGLWYPQINPQPRLPGT